MSSRPRRARMRMSRDGDRLEPKRGDRIPNSALGPLPASSRPGCGRATRALLATFLVWVAVLIVQPTTRALAEEDAPAEKRDHTTEQLIDLDPQRLDRSDDFGLNWDPQVDGMLRDGSNDCFDGAMELKVDHLTFKPTVSRKMTPDASLLVLSGRIGSLLITRRIHVDLELGAARYVEVLHNPAATTAEVRLRLKSTLGEAAQKLVTNTGKVVQDGALHQRDVGLLAFQHGGTRPSALFVVSTPGISVTPTVEIKDGRRITFSWNIVVPAKGRVAILHTVVQRRLLALPAGSSLQALFDPFLTDTWGADLPATVASALANFRGEGSARGGAPAGFPADQEFRTQVQAYEVEDYEGTRLFMERSESMAGQVTGDKLRVATRFGTAELNLTDVVMIRGGANRGRTTHTYLRNGEILAGPIEAHDMLFTAPSGLSFEINPAGLDALFFPPRKNDGIPAPGTSAFMQHLDGTKLALEASPEAELAVATPWGDLRIPLPRVNALQYIRRPGPGFRIECDDGSRFPAAPSSTPLTLPSMRFGAIEVVPTEIAGWNRYGAPAVLLSKFHKWTGPARTHIALPGPSYLVGRVDLDGLSRRTRSGHATLAMDRLYHVERIVDTQTGASRCTWYLRQEGTLQGELGEHLLPFRTPYGRCMIPAQHVLAYRRGADPGLPPLPGATPSASSAKTSDAAPSNGANAPPPVDGVGGDK